MQLSGDIIFLELAGYWIHVRTTDLCQNAGGRVDEQLRKLRIRIVVVGFIEVGEQSCGFANALSELRKVINGNSSVFSLGFRNFFYL